MHNCSSNSIVVMLFDHVCFGVANRRQFSTPKVGAGFRPRVSSALDMSSSQRNSQLDPSQNPNPLTDYDKTLYNWLRPQAEHVTQNLRQSAAREWLAKYVKYKASSFLFFPRLKRVVTGVHTIDDNILRFRFSENRQKWPFLGTFEPPRTDSTLMTS